MFKALRNLLSKNDTPIVPFVDPLLGQFQFDRVLGWYKEVALGNEHAKLVLGSDGEWPSDEMLRTARTWLDAWPLEKPKILDYVRRELLDPTWSDEPDLPTPEQLAVESINILWSDQPTTSMIYFTHPDDDVRSWHVTFERLVPCGFAYDD